MMKDAALDAFHTAPVCLRFSQQASTPRLKHVDRCAAGRDRTEV